MLTRSWRNSRSEVYVAGDLAKREYEDMTSSGIEEVEAENNHELSYKPSLFRENKKRRPPEACNLMQVQKATTVEVQGAAGEDELQASTADSLRRSRSGSRVAVTPDFCGESDLTAENHMAEESSRSSNNNGSSMFDSAAESAASKGLNRQFRSISSLGGLHYFLDHTNGGREVRVSSTSGEGPSHMSNLLVKNDSTHDISRKEMEDMMNHRQIQGFPNLEPAASNRPRSGSIQAHPSATSTVPSQIWERNNQEWLQLGVGSSRDAAANSKQSDPALEGTPLTFGQGTSQERIFAKRKMTTSIDFPIAGAREPDSNIYPGNVNVASTPVQWQLRSSAIPPNYKSKMSSDPSTIINTATLRSDPSFNSMRNLAASGTVPKFDVEQMDLCLFANGISIPTGAARPEFMLAPRSGSVTGNFSSNAYEKDRGVSNFSRVIENSFESHRDQEGFQGVMFPARNETVANTSVDVTGQSGLHNRAGPTLTSTSAPAADMQFRSAQAAGMSMDHLNAFQFQRDSRPCSLSALMQTGEDLRHGQAGYSWLSGPAAESGPRLIPLANNFQGWSSSDSTSNTKLAALGGHDHHGAAPMARHSIPIDQEGRRASDEWGSLFRKVSPNMLFQSQCERPEGSSDALALQSTSQEKNVGSQENLVALKRAIENIQNRPQWPTPEALNLGSVAPWCFNGNPPGTVRGDSKTEVQGFVGEPPLISSMQSERVPVHSRFNAGDLVNLQSGKPPLRQSWQQAAGHTKMHHENVNILKRPSPPNIGKPKIQVLPPASRGTNHAGLWFILQSAENQNGEASLPQISKAYLRIKDGKMPVSAVKKYLVTKLGLTSESEVEITCKGQPVVPSLPLQHVRDVIWFSSVTANREHTLISSSGERDVESMSTTTASEQRVRSPAAADRAPPAATLFSKDILMVLTYRRGACRLMTDDCKCVESRSGFDPEF